jgi:biotin carboxyl carrier protein
MSVCWCARKRPKAARSEPQASEVEQVECKGSAMPTEVAAEIAGNVWKIETTVGAQVEEEEVLLILESMKMEIPVEAPRAGRVAEVRVAEGDSIEEGAVLVVLD